MGTEPQRLMRAVQRGARHAKPARNNARALWKRQAPGLRVDPAEGEGNEGSPPPPEKDLESPSSIHALEKEMATHSSVLAWRIPGTGETGGL